MFLVSFAFCVFIISDNFYIVLWYIRINCDILNWHNLEIAKTRILKKSDNSLLGCNVQTQFKVLTKIAFQKASNGSISIKTYWVFLSFFLSFFLSIHTAKLSLEDFEQAYIVHTGFAGWKPTRLPVKSTYLFQLQASPDRSTNEVGGWCGNTSLENGGEHITDIDLVKTLSRVFRDKTVGSFGDGPGAYKRETEKLGDVKLYDAYDRAPFCEETSGGRVKFLDLTVPQYGLPLYDWIICLEVAEHIPEMSEAIYLDNLARHCR